MICLKARITPQCIFLVWLGVFERFVISVLFCAADFLSQEHRCHIYHPHYVTDDAILQSQLSAMNILSGVDEDELLFPGCDTKLPEMQQ